MIFFLRKEGFSNHKEQPRIIFVILRAAGLKYNYPKWSFGLKKIPYLGYVITWEGIQPNPKKVQGIMDLRWPTTMAEAQVLIDMVKYYRDMRIMHSNIY